jgi:hypothetical protein
MKSGMAAIANRKTGNVVAAKNDNSGDNGVASGSEENYHIGMA